MIYKTHYDSPLGGMLLSADDKGLTGLTDRNILHMG